MALLRRHWGRPAPLRTSGGSGLRDLGAGGVDHESGDRQRRRGEKHREWGSPPCHRRRTIDDGQQDFQQSWFPIPGNSIPTWQLV
jgi:hypothetical protein